MTREHRENLTKLAKQLSNKAKESLRRVRSDALTRVKRAKEGHSEDTIRLVEKQVGGGYKETSTALLHMRPVRQVRIVFIKVNSSVASGFIPYCGHMTVVTDAEPLT